MKLSSDYQSSMPPRQDPASLEAHPGWDAYHDESWQVKRAVFNGAHIEECPVALPSRFGQHNKCVRSFRYYPVGRPAHASMVFTTENFSDCYRFQEFAERAARYRAEDAAKANRQTKSAPSFTPAPDRPAGRSYPTMPAGQSNRYDPRAPDRPATASKPSNAQSEPRTLAECEADLNHMLRMIVAVGNNMRMLVLAETLSDQEFALLLSTARASATFRSSVSSASLAAISTHDDSARIAEPRKAMRYLFLRTHPDKIAAHPQIDYIRNLFHIVQEVAACL